tara:strand:- start:2959 stop:3228 length:270 start_codon:yes stop_codon:yes gene_type:complete
MDPTVETMRYTAVSKALSTVKALKSTFEHVVQLMSSEIFCGNSVRAWELLDLAIFAALMLGWTSRASDFMRLLFAFLSGIWSAVGRVNF